KREGPAAPQAMSRELSILRGAVSWWRAQGWVRTDPTPALPTRSAPVNTPPELSPDQLTAIFGLPVNLREQVCWHLLYETTARVERILSLNIDDLDLVGRRLRAPRDHRAGHAPREPEIRW